MWSQFEHVIHVIGIYSDLTSIHLALGKGRVSNDRIILDFRNIEFSNDRIYSGFRNVEFRITEYSRNRTFKNTLIYCGHLRIVLLSV